MSNEERLQHLLNIDDPTNEEENKKFKKLFNEIVEDLNIAEELKYPDDEYENENYLCTRQAYYNEYLGQLCFAYTVYKWDGTYIKRENKLKLDLKFKNWIEIFHTGTATIKQKLDEDYINGIIKIRNLVGSRRANERKN